MVGDVWLPDFLLPRCPVSDKLQYEDEQECAEACRKAEKKHGLEPGARRPYHCQVCLTYHITSKDWNYQAPAETRRGQRPAREVTQPLVSKDMADRLLELRHQLEEEG